MKRTIVLSLLVFVATLLFANDKYEQAMQQNIGQVYQAKTIEEFQKAVNAFERIGASEKTKWEPYYYASFGYIMMSTRETDPVKKDGQLDMALEAMKKAAELSPNNSEVVTLEGFIHMMRVSVDPATRGQQYSGMSMQAFGKALGLDANNPRALSLMARMQFGTAQFFKSSVEEPCAMASQALEKFESFKSDNPLAPRWGKEMTMGMIKDCGQK